MSTWKVSVEKIEILEHPNADSMEIGKVGTYQVCVQKGLYKDGDLIAFVPEKAILPDDLKGPFENYLAGTNKDRVKSVRLRGEFSCGIILPLDKVKEKCPDFKVGEDISQALGISKYEPPIPVHMAGDVKRIPESYEDKPAGKHDCEHYRTYSGELTPGERVVITEKIHGSQAIYSMLGDLTELSVSSKGLLSKGLVLAEAQENLYWAASKNSGLAQVFSDVAEAQKTTKEDVIRVFGEALPCQKGFSYGYTTPSVLLFDIRVNGVSIPYDQVPESAKAIWVPVLFDGPFSEEVAVSFSLGKESESGKELHIKEGCVVAPYIDRRAGDGTRLRLKIINPKYKETGEELT